MLEQGNKVCRNGDIFVLDSYWLKRFQNHWPILREARQCSIAANTSHGWGARHRHTHTNLTYAWYWALAELPSLQQITYIISKIHFVFSTNLEWFSNSRRSRNRLQRFITLIIFGLNLVLGYMAMLVAMTYSIELFVCLILGFCVSYFTIYWKYLMIYHT